MATNDFLPFGTGAGANVLDQSAFAGLPARSTGFQSGVAFSAGFNKVWRQSAFVAAMIGQFTADYGGDALDNGDLPTFEAHFKAALAAWIASGSSPIDLSDYVLRAGDTMTGLFASPAGFKTAARVLTASTTLTSADYGKIIDLSSGSTFTTTFPTPVGNGGAWFTLYNASGISQTVATPAGAFVGPGASSLTTDAIPAGSVRKYESDGFNWVLSSSVAAPLLTAALPKFSVITTSSTFTPVATAKKAFVLAHGPGGAGGGTYGAYGWAGQGGASGGWAMSMLDYGTIGYSAISCTIPAGGAGVSGANGGAGAGNTSFGAHVVAGPGGGGTIFGGGIAVPGTGITGQFIGRGNPGGAFNNDNGITGYTADGPGIGGAGLFGGAGLAWDGIAVPGKAGYGAGGGGGDKDDLSSGPGGEGGDGFILVVEI